MAYFENRYWQRNLRALPPTGNKENKQGMMSYLIIKTQVLDAAICREDYADSLLGQTRRTIGAP
jgi:hypothetical protein